MNSFDFSQFTDLISQVERLGADLDKVAENVLDAGSEPARKAFADNLPYDTKTPQDKRQHRHARDHVKVSKSSKSRWGNKYRLIGATSSKGNSISALKRIRKGDNSSGDEFEYLSYVEYGHSKAPSHPFLQKAHNAAKAAASEPMREALLREIENHLR